MSTGATASGSFDAREFVWWVINFKINPPGPVVRSQQWTRSGGPVDLVRWSNHSSGPVDLVRWSDHSSGPGPVDDMTLSQAGYKVQVIVQIQTLDLYNDAIAG